MKWMTDADGHHSKDSGFRIARALLLVVASLISLAIIWSGVNYIRTPRSRTLVVYCFSGMQEVVENAIFPAFQKHWLEENGEMLEFIATYAGSGKIIDSILERFPAEVAILSSSLDAKRLSARGIPTEQWQQDLPHEGIINRTPLIMVTREDNPEGLASYSDLIRPGIEIVYPNPQTSGAGQWGIMAVHGSMLHESGAGLTASDVLKGMKENTVIQPPNAREALQRFVGNKGDVLITYESNLLETPIRERIDGELVYPPRTVLCEPVVVPFDKNATSKQKDLINSFIQYLWSREAQGIFVEYGFHSVDGEQDHGRTDFGRIAEPITLEFLGSHMDVKKMIDEEIRSHFSP